MKEERARRAYYYKHVVKRHLRQTKENIAKSLNAMERSYYTTHYDASASHFAQAMGISEELIRRFN